MPSRNLHFIFAFDIAKVWLHLELNSVLNLYLINSISVVWGKVTLRSCISCLQLPVVGDPGSKLTLKV